MTRRAGSLTAWLFLAPYLVLFVAFVLAPIFLGLWISLHDWDFTLPGKPFVGLDNYTALLDPGSVSFEPFWNSMQATGIFTLFSVPLLIVVPLAVALVMNEKFRGRNLFRAVYFAPYVLGVAVVGVMWRFLLDRNIGAINSYLGALGLPDDIAWLSSMPAAWVALVGVTVWWTLGFNAVIYLAGLQDIPRELYEAARVDGATALGVVPPRHAAGAAAGDDVRHADHDHRLGQHVRSVVPHDQRSPRPGDPDGDLLDRRDRAAELPDGRGRGRLLDPHPRAHAAVGRGVRRLPAARQPGGVVKALRYGVLVVLTALFISPLLFMVLTSFKTARAGRPDAARRGSPTRSRPRPTNGS